jgi:hypothetical protein
MAAAQRAEAMLVKGWPHRLTFCCAARRFAQCCGIGSLLRRPTPIEGADEGAVVHRLFGVHPNYESLRTFGCACWPSLRKYNAHKLVFRSKQCVFLDYSPMHKGYKCLDKSSGRIYISRDVVFEIFLQP